MVAATARPGNVSKSTIWDSTSMLIRRILGFRRRHGYFPNIFRPRTLSEKILCKILFDRDPNLVTTTDKLAVREFVRIRTNNAVSMPQVLFSTDRPEDLYNYHLPFPCVMKSNHASGHVKFITKENYNAHELVQIAKEWLSDNYGRTGQWAYSKVRPKVFFEEFIGAEGINFLVPFDDVKIFCFHGRPKLIQMDFDRFNNHTRDLLWLDFEKIPVRYIYNNIGKKYEKPKLLGEMLKYASLLSEKFDFCRIDFYNADAVLLLSEITHYPENGVGLFHPKEYDEKFGEFWTNPRNTLLHRNADSDSGKDSLVEIK